MSQTIEVDVVTVGRYQTPNKQKDFVFAGEMVSSKAPIKTMCIGILLGTRMGGDSKLKAKVHVRPIGSGGKYEGLPKYLKENTEDLALLMTKTSLYIMDKASAEELERLKIDM